LATNWAGILSPGTPTASPPSSRRDDLPDMARFELRNPRARLARFIAAKGSVTLDGVSLTVNTGAGT